MGYFLEGVWRNGGGGEGAKGIGGLVVYFSEGAWRRGGGWKAFRPVTLKFAFFPLGFATFAKNIQKKFKHYISSNTVPTVETCGRWLPGASRGFPADKLFSLCIGGTRYFKSGWGGGGGSLNNKEFVCSKPFMPPLKGMPPPPPPSTWQKCKCPTYV